MGQDVLVFLNVGYEQKCLKGHYIYSLPPPPSRFTVYYSTLKSQRNLIAAENANGYVNGDDV